MYSTRFNLNLTNGNKLLNLIKSLLTKNHLTLDPQIETFILVYNEQDNLVACGGLAGNIIKCVAIDAEYQGEGLALILCTELVNLAYELGRTNLFIYTKPEYEKLFKACGFYSISHAYPNVVLLENSATRLAKQCQIWSNLRVCGEKIGAIVMNANPFTLGHRYLIEKALQQCEHLHLFVVGEDASKIPYRDRFALVQQGIADLKHITLHQGSDYIISQATFPSYFLKEKGMADELYLELDLRLFREKIAPALGITHRFVGNEPFCAVTAEYNRQMYYWLSIAAMDSNPIKVVELERLTCHGQAISASQVRQLWQQQNWEALNSLVPVTTLDYLQQHSVNNCQSI
ncbi:[citrate (pro-3S)-lyase] ligase [Lonepinella sp. MS14437]|uniref:[citrate (pro-3S)-lyase] ligase n=1 Tax=Lonepinella sp. MS14437 TaxID=3003620 RepID=UPI0036DF0BEB